MRVFSLLLIDYASFSEELLVVKDVQFEERYRLDITSGKVTNGHSE